MFVPKSIESNVNILANSPMAENISSILKNMPFDVYHCEDATDAFMIPCFILFLDGNVLTPDNQNIDQWECCLTGWTGRMQKCIRCRNYCKCIKVDSVDAEKIDIGPNYKEPIILLNAGKRQREVENLVTLIPPMPVEEKFSLELTDWLKLTCFIWHKKALEWRKEFNQWQAIKNQKYFCKTKTHAEIATERWMPRELNVVLPRPDFE